MAGPTPYEVKRSTVVMAPPERAFDLINSFENWPQWSPWEDLDPDQERKLSGPAAGVGAVYEWQGNRKAGQGRMEITGSTPTSSVAMDLHFDRPFKADNKVLFTLAPSGAGTEVTWSMTGEQAGLMKLLGKLMPMDRMVGRDFEKGLSRIKAVAETS